jgi:hypothetical protein
MWNAFRNKVGNRDGAIITSRGQARPIADVKQFFLSRVLGLIAERAFRCIGAELYQCWSRSSKRTAACR